MKGALKDHQLSITVGTVVVCVIGVFTTAYGLGQDRAIITNRMNENKQIIDRHVLEDERKFQEQQKFNEKVDRNIEDLKDDVGTMKNDIKWIKEHLQNTGP